MPIPQDIAFPFEKRWTLESLLGEGGMGRVLLARQGKFKAAFKFLQPKSGVSPASLREEVKILSKLRHPRLLRIFDFYEFDQLPSIIENKESDLFSSIPAGSPCFSMEYLEGKPLQETPPDPRKVSEYLFQSLEALDFIHRFQILHCDLKPSNLFLTSDGNLKLFDFGLSRIRGSEVQAEALGGTAFFQAPETFLGRVDPRSDIFSLGMTFYRWLSGEFPYARPLFPQFLRQAGDPVPLGKRVQGLSRYVEDAIMRMISVDPERRPNSAASLMKYFHHQDPRHVLPELWEHRAALQHFPFVGREREIGRLLGANAALKPAEKSRLILLRGPTGIGRTRFLVELRWRSILSGTKVELLATSQGYRARLPSETEAPLLLIYPDLHQDPDRSWLALRQALSQWEGAPSLHVLEFNDELVDLPDLAVWARDLKWDYEEIELKALSESDFFQLADSLGLSTGETSKMWREALSAAGGRPLLWRECLRQQSESEDAVLGEISLRHSAAARLSRLSEDATLLLALFLSAHADPSLGDLAAAARGQIASFESALLELDRREILDWGRDGGVKLSHPSLREYWLAALPANIGKQAHRIWLEGSHAGSAVEKFHHAVGADNTQMATSLALPAITALFEAGAFRRAIQWCEIALNLDLNDELRSRIYALQAPLLFRVARYSESLKAYENWRRLRGDDESRLQATKFHYYQGLVNFSWGKRPEARYSLGEATSLSDAVRFPALAPYQAKAFHLMAILDQDADHPGQALEYLQMARPLIGNDAEALAENDHRLGELKMAMLDLPAAREALQSAIQRYEGLGKRSGLAGALHSLAMLERLEGRVEAAQDCFDKIFGMVTKESDVLQWARYQGNLALLQMECGHFNHASRLLENGEKILCLLGNPSDLEIMRLQFATFFLMVGLWHRVERVFWDLSTESKGEGAQSLQRWALSLRGDAALASGDGKLASKIGRRLLEMKSGSPIQEENAHWLFFQGQALTGDQDVSPEDWKKFLSKSRLKDLPSMAGVKAVLSWAFHPIETEEALNTIRAQVASQPYPEKQLFACRVLIQSLQSLGYSGLAREFLVLHQSIIHQLKAEVPEECLMDFEKNRSLKDLEAELKAPLRKAEGGKPGEIPNHENSIATAISEPRFRHFCEISRQIYHLEALPEILERVMDAAIEITGAERGFLLLKNEEGQSGGWRGFQVRSARHYNHEDLEDKDTKISLSVIEAAMGKGAPLLTQNAMFDERLQDMQSVQKYQLKSILALPLEIGGKILGALYLDHTYQANRFSEADVAIVAGFASLASMAIEKARKFQKLQRSNEELSSQVKVKSEELAALAAELQNARRGLKHDYKDIVGASPKMMKVFQMMDHIAPTKIPVWILGESGTGKELIAQALHQYSPRREGPFVSENCGSIPENLLESELFGHKKGAFTHADRDRVGLIEQANGGTLFLDEIADMPMGMQVKLLRVLQEGEVRPLGSNKKVKVDIRLITASNQDLRKMVKQGKFREDLLYRVNGVTLQLPPLRERKEDIPLLIQHLVKKISREYGLQAATISPETFDYLVSQKWPGNVRQFEGFLRNLLLFAQGNTVSRDVLNIQLENSREQEGPSETSSEKMPEDSDSEERAMIIAALKKFEMDKQKVADDFGLSIKSIYAKMEKLKIPRRTALLKKFLETH